MQGSGVVGGVFKLLKCQHLNDPKDEFLWGWFSALEIRFSWSEPVLNAHSPLSSMLRCLASSSQIWQCMEFWLILNSCKLWQLCAFKWLNRGEISIAPFERERQWNSDAHPPTRLPVTASTVAAQSLGTGLVSKQRSQASNETKVWDSLLVIKKKKILLCFHKCINKAVKAFWIAKLFLASFCLHSLFYRTRRNLWLFSFSWKSCWERSSQYKAKELEIYSAKLY